MKQPSSYRPVRHSPLGQTVTNAPSEPVAERKAAPYFNLPPRMRASEQKLKEKLGDRRFEDLLCLPEESASKTAANKTLAVKPSGKPSLRAKLCSAQAALRAQQELPLLDLVARLDGAVLDGGSAPAGQPAELKAANSAVAIHQAKLANGWYFGFGRP